MSHCPTDPAPSRPETLMGCAVRLALKGRGPTAPNPCVGAVLADGDEIVASGWHRAYGQPHAERECLADARAKGVDPAGLTLYVTLEPCNHHGKTPPCTEAIIQAGVGEVVVGIRDPNPVAAGGIERLRKHGITVRTGVLEQECADLIADFRLWQHSTTPFNILKMAATLDGRISSRQRKPEAVSCPESFGRVHDLRSRVDAVIVGGETFRADNPSLTCRLDALPDNFTQPYAVVITSRLPGDPEAFTLLHSRPERTVFLTTDQAARSPEADTLRQRGTSVWPLPGEPGNLNLSMGFERLRYDLGCHYTLIEGGGRLAMQCVSQGLADELIQFVAPRILGDTQAPSAYSGREDVLMADAVNFRIIRTEQVGTDVMLTMRPL